MSSSPRIPLPPTPAAHPDDGVLALLASQDLTWPQSRRVRRHVERCARCHEVVSGFEQQSAALAGLGEPPELQGAGDRTSRTADQVRLEVLTRLRADRDHSAIEPLGWGASPARAILRTSAALATLLALVALGLAISRTLSGDVSSPETARTRTSEPERVATASADAASSQAATLEPDDQASANLASDSTPEPIADAPDLSKAASDPPSSQPQPPEIVSATGPDQRSPSPTEASPTGAPDSVVVEDQSGPEAEDTLVQLVADDDLVIYWLVEAD